MKFSRLCQYLFSPPVLVGLLSPTVLGLFWLAGILIHSFLFGIELISHSARIMSLSIRLFANMFGEHTAGGIFRTLVPLDAGSWKLIYEVPASILSPVPVMALGLIAALIQTYIFIMLSSIYIAEAGAHEEGHEAQGHESDGREGHGEGRATAQPAAAH